MFNSSSKGGFEKGLYYLERLLDVILRFFNALRGNGGDGTTAPTDPSGDDTVVE